MADNASRKPPLGWKSLLGQALFVIIILLAARILWVRRQPERLPLPGAFHGATLATTDDARYMVAGGIYAVQPAAMTVQAQALPKGQLRTLCTEDPAYQLYIYKGFTNTAGVWEGNLYYAVQARTVRAPDLTAFAGVHTGREGSYFFVGTFSLAQNAPHADGAAVQRSRYRPEKPAASEIRFRQVALQGGKPKDVAILRGENCCLVGNHVFWIQPGQEEVEDVSQQKSPKEWIVRREISAHSDLMLTSLADGTTRCIRHGIPRLTDLTAGHGGVAWTEPALYPQRPTLWYARVADGSVRTLGTAARVTMEAPAFTEFENRLYWMAQADAGRPSTLMRANMDGTSPSAVGGLAERYQLQNLLYVYQGGLYALATGATMADKIPFSLARLYPYRSDPVEILRKLAGKGEAAETISSLEFHGGYLYFERREPKPDLWRKLTGDYVGADLMQVAYRIPLQH